MPIPTTISSIELITCRVIKALSQSAVESIKQQLIDISADGKVTKDKLPTVMSLMTYLDNLSHTLGELRLSCQKALSAGGVNVKG